MEQLWMFVAGLGLFLLGMTFLETAIRELGGQTFRKFLREQTSHPAKAIVVGILVTAILQSSSLVTLMLLALTGAGMMQLKNALGVVIGANLGTTFTGWLVTTIGFKLPLDSIAMPLVGIGCIGVVFAAEGSRPREWFRLMVGFGFLLMGLEEMKSSAEHLPELIDVSRLQGLGSISCLILGFLLTVVIQSSSATMMITLSALNADILQLQQAAALVIGADLGTTVKTVLGALQGSAIKKQVALAHVLFNLVTDLVAFALLVPILYVLQEHVAIQDPQYTLVAFHSSFNVIGIVLFYPLLGQFARFLERMFQHVDTFAAHHVQQVPPAEPELFITAIEADLRDLLDEIMHHNTETLRISGALSSKGVTMPPADLLEGNNSRYYHVKDMQAEILRACILLQTQALTPETGIRLNQLMSAVRQAAHCAKSIKDLRDDIRKLTQSEQPAEQQLLGHMGTEMIGFYGAVLAIVEDEHSDARFERLAALRQRERNLYQDLWLLIRSALQDQSLSDEDAATLINVNRELYSSNKALLETLAGLLLPESAARDLDLLPE